MANKSYATRPYWHVDAKWIFAIIFIVSVTAALTFFSLSRLTAENTAVPIVTAVVASMFSPDGLDEEGDIEIIREQILQGSEDVIYPIPGQQAVITREELEVLSPRELRLRIFHQLVEPYYLHGVDHVAASITDDLAEQEEIKKEAGFLKFLNIEIHYLIRRIFFISLIPTLVGLLGLLYFSWRLGRLVSPGLALLLPTFIPALILLVANITVRSADFTEKTTGILAEVLPIAVKALGPVYWLPAGLGILLLLIAGIAFVRQKRASSAVKNSKNSKT